jgi:phosphonate transport system ATP-binding protein
MGCLARVGLAQFATQRADRLSGGQSQRVAIARALMQRPGLLLADEPAASLDPAAGEEVMRIFRDLVDREGLTVIFTSHHIGHARAYAGRVVGLRAGRVVLDAPTTCLDGDAVDALYA